MSSAGFPHSGLADEAARQLGVPPEEILDFSANLNPAGLPPRAAARLASEAADPRLAARYPDPEARELHGLHSLDFPWLYKRRPLWDIIMIAFMAGGTALCVTSLILAWRVVKRNVMRLFGTGRELIPWEDLIEIVEEPNS
jgi:hypothetical protein